jgi:hypothetical protein
MIFFVFLGMPVWCVFLSYLCTGYHSPWIFFQAEWKCHSIYWPGEAFDIMRGTWFYDANWQPLPCEQADRVEQEHLLRFRSHKMADYVWDSTTGTRLESQVRNSLIQLSKWDHFKAVADKHNFKMFVKNKPVCYIRWWMYRYLLGTC